MDKTDLASLSLLASKKENLPFVTRDLTNLSILGTSAGSAFFSGSEEDFTRVVKELNCRLAAAPEVKKLFDLFLLTRYLLTSPENIPGWAEPWLESNIDIERHYPGIHLRHLADGHFRAVPVVTVMREGCIQYFITGVIEGPAGSRLWPDWVDPLLDGEAQQSIKSAANAARRHTAFEPGKYLYCYPLTKANQKCQFKGPSLGLALALGFWSVLRDRPISNRLLATGSIDNTGNVGSVGNLDLKLSYASGADFRVFLRPDQDFPGSPPNDLEVIPVADFTEARLVASLHAPGRGQELLNLLSMLQNPRALVNNLDQVHHLWIRRISRQNKWHRIADDVMASPNLAADFIEKLDRLIKDRNLDAADTISGLISPDMFQRLKATSTLTAFKFCISNLGSNNHRGNVAQSDRWASEGQTLYAAALKADINACADFINKRFVSRHNRYTFDPELPETVANILDCLEKRYALQRESGCSSDIVLGELCGTIAQNYAFCGPDYITDFEDFIKRAVRAFGSHQIQEYAHQIRQERCYQIYARLDASLIDQADSMLRAYLAIDSWHDLKPLLDGGSLGPFDHAVLARFLADTTIRDTKRVYFRWALERSNSISGNDHPWQLWSYNLGRIAHDLEDHEAAVKMYEQSLNLCMADDRHPTVLVMALLAAAGLRQMNALGSVFSEENENRIKRAAKKLDQAHFQPFFNTDFKTILDSIWAEPQAYFPFTYR